MTGLAPVEVRFQGVRGSIPSPASQNLRFGGNTSCVELRTNEQLLILDAGTGIRNLGDDLMMEFGDRPINADLLISHTHWDHIQGLPFFGPAYLPQNRIRILAAHGRGDLVERALRNQMNPMNFPVGFEQMRGVTGVEELDSDDVDLGQFSIKVIALNHPGGCAGFRIATRGVAVGYLPDHEPYSAGNETARAADPRRKALVDFVRELDLLILDTQYTDAEYVNRIGWGHGCLSESIALAAEAKVRRLILFHHDPSHNDDQLDRMVEAAQTLAAGSQLLVSAAAENEIITPGAMNPSACAPQLRAFPKIAAG
jgi:phosphoribosyl 1,2-cyclic phosphodiesterase